MGAVFLRGIFNVEGDIEPLGAIAANAKLKERTRLYALALEQLLRTVKSAKPLPKRCGLRLLLYAHREKLASYDAADRCCWVRNDLSHGEGLSSEADWQYAETIFKKAIEEIFPYLSDSLKRRLLGQEPSASSNESRSDRSIFPTSGRQARSVSPRLKILPKTSTVPLLPGECKEIAAPELRAVFEIFTYNRVTGTRGPGRVRISVRFPGEDRIDIIDADTGEFVAHNCESCNVDVSSQKTSRLEIRLHSWFEIEYLYGVPWDREEIKVFHATEGPQFEPPVVVDQVSCRIHFLHVESGESVEVRLVYTRKSEQE